MAIQLLGPSIDYVLKLCNGRFEMPTVLLMAIQMIERIMIFHSKRYIHRDIKPENFALGLAELNQTIYIIDYGLAKKYKNPMTSEHIPFRRHKKLTGTARYASINTHLGYEQSRRDDLECLGYTLIFLAKGDLPWQGINEEDKNAKHKKIYDAKLAAQIETLCQGLPKEFAKYMHYCRDLKFEDKPNYRELKELFLNCFYNNRYDGFEFDWIRLGIDLDRYKRQEATLSVSKPSQFNGFSYWADKLGNESNIKLKSNDVRNTERSGMMSTNKYDNLPKNSQYNIIGGVFLNNCHRDASMQNCQLNNSFHNDTTLKESINEEDKKDGLCDLIKKKTRKIEVAKLAEGFPKYFPPIENQEDKKTVKKNAHLDVSVNTPTARSPYNFKPSEINERNAHGNS